MTKSHRSQANRILGYPDDARLLIINADDFGRCHASNEATLRTLTQGVVTSTSLMVPCPWALHAMHLLSDHPEIPFGVHLTVICETPYYRWGPLTSREKVPSLIDETGFFYNYERRPEFLAKAKLSELEVEFRAQIEAVLHTKLVPDHLDWHCLHHGGRGDIFELTVRLAKEYGLALRVSDRPLIEDLQQQGLPTNDHALLNSYEFDPASKSAYYTRALRELPVGLNEWGVHPGLGTPELQALEPESWQVRQTDFDFLMSEQARQIIEREGIVLLSYQPLQKVWQQFRSSPT